MSPITQGNILKSLIIILALGCAPYGIAGTSNADVPLFTPFNWAQSNTGFSIKGNACTHISKLGNLGCGPATIVVDSPNNRIFIDVGKHGGQYFLLKDASYINEAIPGRGCLKVPGFTFASQIAGYQNVLSTPDSTSEKATYVGLAVCRKL
ncbi:MAG: hypothetical protein ACYCQI_02415 [Gammaproteobacteria bacterium]